MRGTWASKSFVGWSPLEASLPQPVTKHAVPGRNLAPLGRRQTGNLFDANDKGCFNRIMAAGEKQLIKDPKETRTYANK